VHKKGKVNKLCAFGGNGQERSRGLMGAGGFLRKLPRGAEECDRMDCGGCSCRLILCV